MNPVRDILLPASKSIVQRYMLIGAVVFDDFYLRQKPTSHDVEVMGKALAYLSETVVDCADSGTALRLLTAYLATLPTPHILKGAERLSQRPIKPLVEALQQLGAEIADNWPLYIKGPLSGSETTIDASQSSQFLTALMLIAPTLPKGLTIVVEGEQASTPYIRMTEEVMRDCGVELMHNGNRLIIPHQSYRLPHREIEADWSAAAFFYEMVALQPTLQLQLHGLNADSWQGDAIAQAWFKPLGVTTAFNTDGALLKGAEEETEPLTYDFTNHPDLFMALAATACGKRHPFVFSGLHNLLYKESRRLGAMSQALRDLGFHVTTDENKGIMSYDGEWEKPQQDVVVDGCNDHRIVMALAPLKRLTRLHIKGEEAVAKSFPDFWNQFAKTL